MPKNPKRPKDPNQLAKLIADIATGELVKVDEAADKDLVVSASRRKGGLKGGKARAEKLTPEQRSSIARKAAENRWQKSRLQAEE